MALQTSVGTEHAIGVPGDLFVPDQAMYYPSNLLAASGGVTCGKFVYLSSGQATNTPSGAPLGIAQRNLSYPLMTVTNGASLVIPEGYPVQTISKGDVIVEATDSATVGASVYVNASGAIVTSSASGAVDTGWKVAQGGVSGGYIVIYNH